MKHQDPRRNRPLALLTLLAGLALTGCGGGGGGGDEQQGQNQATDAVWDEFDWDDADWS